MAIAAGLMVPVVPGVAQASTVQAAQQSEYELPPFSTRIVFFAGGNEVNNVSVFGNGAGVRVVDTAGISAGPGCIQIDPVTADCPQRSADAPIRSFSASLGNLDDRLVNDSDLADFPTEEDFEGFGSTRFFGSGGDGNDDLTGSNVDNDSLGGGPGDDVTRGRGGDDSLFEGAFTDDGDQRTPDGADRLFGGAGADSMDGGTDNDLVDGESGDDSVDGGTGPDAINGGAGIDFLRYSQDVVDFETRRTDRGITRNGAGIGVTLNDAAATTANGQPGENDTISGIEDVQGTVGRDTLNGSQSGNILIGGDGDDLITGFGGNDNLMGGRDADDIRAQDGLVDRVNCGGPQPGDRAAVDSIDQVGSCPEVGQGLNVAPAPAGPPVVIREPVPTTPPRVKAQRFTATLRPKRDRRAPFRFTVSGKLTAPAGVRPADACAGRVSVQIKAIRKTISTRRRTLSAACTYKSTVTFRNRKRFAGRSSLSIRVRFLGNPRILPVKLKPLKARVR